MFKKGLGIGLLILVVTVAGFWWGKNRQPVTNLNPKSTQVAMRMGQAKLKVEVRATEAERELGLSYRPSLGENEGMVFKFPTAAQYGFWMKGMKFDLDMIWIREGQVVDISSGVPAPKNDSAPLPVVRPSAPADMVLEVNAGWSERHGVKVGDLVVL